MSSPRDVDERVARTPFLLHTFYRHARFHHPNEFNIPPFQQANSSRILDHSSLLPPSLRRQSVQLYAWLDCSLGELTSLLANAAPRDVHLDVGTRVEYKLVYNEPLQGSGGRGEFAKWTDKHLGSVIVGGREAALPEEDEEMANGGSELTDDAGKTLGEARFVVGDYICCTILRPDKDGKVASVPALVSLPRENGYGGRDGSNSYVGSGFGGGRGGSRDGLGIAPPAGDWRRGEMPPGPRGGRGGFGGFGGFGGRGRGRGRW